MSKKTKKTYTVIGIYADNNQRYADSFKAVDAEDAENQAVALAKKEEGCELLVAGVVEGDVKMAS